MKIEGAVDEAHVAKITQVLAQLTDLSPARAMLVCEDAGVALSVALRSGLTVSRALELMGTEIKQLLQEDSQ